MPQAQHLQDLDLGRPSTLEVVTWNIETFPKNGFHTIDSVREVIRALNADLYAFQEIGDTNWFQRVIDDLPDYHVTYFSEWYAGLAIAYRHDSVLVDSIYEIYTTFPYWSEFPRSPLVFEFTFRSEKYILINNHLKCCGDEILDLSDPDDEETRRLNAMNLLKDYIDLNWSDEKVILVGDLNDNLQDTPAHNVFQAVLDDSLHYQFADIGIANEATSNWSYPSWPSHLDHILITDELFDVLDRPYSSIQTIKVDEFLPGGWSEYDAKISDHRPVALKLQVDSVAVGIEKAKYSFVYKVFPNPANTMIHLSLPRSMEPVSIQLFDGIGRLVWSEAYVNSEKMITIPISHIQEGRYWISIRVGAEKVIFSPVLVIRS